MTIKLAKSQSHWMLFEEHFTGRLTCQGLAEKPSPSYVLGCFNFHKVQSLFHPDSITSIGQL